MKGLRKALAPFAPDSSGAVSVLFDLKGIVVICDAGGCTGNVCAFDEPRWFTGKSAIFSAGLRDMDAILGRDDRLIAKLEDTAEKLDCRFAAIIGTPVPAVIATDYQALCRMTEKKAGLPTIAVDSSGTRLYDEGASKAFLALFRRFASGEKAPEKGYAGVIGVTPLDFYGTDGKKALTEKIQARGYQQVRVYGYDGGLDAYENAGRAEKNFVVSPAGLEAAVYLEKTFGTPYEVTCPAAEEVTQQALQKSGISVKGKKVLVVHQQIYANEIRNCLQQYEPEAVTVASWFLMKKELQETGDWHLTEEDEWHDFLLEGGFDLVIADQKLRKAVPEYQGLWIPLPHYAVSGQMGCEQSGGGAC